MNITTRLYIGFAVAIALVLAVGFVSYSAFQRQAEESGWVQHTYKVMNVTGEIQNLTFDMEASRRGYRLTNQERFLDGYNEALTRIPVAMEQLKSLVRDNPRQLERAARMEQHLDELTAYYKNLGLTIPNYSEAQKVTITENEKKFITALRQDFADIFHEEETLLKERETINDRVIKNAILTLLIGIPLILAVVIRLIMAVLSEFKNRRQAQNEIVRNLEQLEMRNREANARNWQLAGVSKINDSLQGADDLKSLTQSAIASIAKYVDAPAGVFYFHDEEREYLQILGAVGVTPDASKNQKIGEGLIGGAAAKKEITIIKDLPAGYWKIQSATGSTLPDRLICVPLWLKDELKGVIELGMFSAASEEKIELLKVVAHNIALAVDAADASEKVASLLSRVQEQKEILESQQEELRQTNEELTRQSEVLQASEEELRVQEEELRQINAELEERNEAVEVARQALVLRTQELEQSSKYKSEFLANMSHELRTPLNSILILAKLLSENKNQNLTEKQAEYAKIIHKSGTDLLNLINDILDLSKIEAGKIEMNFEPVLIKDVEQDIHQMFDVVAEEKGIELMIATEEDVPEKIHTDRQRLQQVIKNLMSNAMKFTSRAGRVTAHISVSPRKELNIAVIDTGIGISKDKQKLIFEAFQQADGSTSRKYGGTGLGLSISKELVRRLGGEINLESSEGQGSTFTIVLPLSKTEAVVKPAKVSEPGSNGISHIPEPVAEQTKVKDDRNSIAKGDKLILIIEDDTSFATLVKNFAHDKGYKAIVAMAGDEGLYYARKYLPSAIILDMGLPVLDGRSVLKILKSDEKLKNIPVHVVSGEEKSKLSIIGAEGFTQKPVDAAGLEGAFDSISGYIAAGYKHILFVTKSDTLDISDLYKFSDQRNLGIDYERVSDVDSALNQIRSKKYDCVMVDSEDDISEGVRKVRLIKDAFSDLIVFVYVRKDITAAEEVELQKYANAIIRRSSFDKERLMDELELFLFKIKESEMLPVPKGIIDITDRGLEGKKVLLVDDDMRNVFALNTLLEEQGMEVITAGDGKEALDLLAKNRDVNIVLMDIMMPEMDGYTAMKRIREQKQYNNLPVIALTAKAMAEDREKCIAAGASDYITKPVDNNKLLSLMRVWLSK